MTRILRVKLRAGLFDRNPNAGAFAGKADAARRARARPRSGAQVGGAAQERRGVLPLAAGGACW